MNILFLQQTGSPVTYFAISCAAFLSTSPRGQVALTSCNGKENLQDKQQKSQGHLDLFSSLRRLRTAIFNGCAMACWFDVSTRCALGNGGSPLAAHCALSRAKADGVACQC